MALALLQMMLRLLLDLDGRICQRGQQYSQPLSISDRTVLPGSVHHQRVALAESGVKVSQELSDGGSTNCHCRRVLLHMAASHC